MSSSSPGSPVEAPPLVLVWGAGPANTAEYAGIRISAKRQKIRDAISSHLAACGETVDVRFSEDADLSSLAERVGRPRREALWTERVDVAWSVALIALDVPEAALTVRD